MMNFRYIIKILFLCLLFSCSLFGGELRDKSLTEIKNNFSSDVKISEFKLILDEDLKKAAEKEVRLRFIAKFVYYYEISQNDSVIGYALLDNVSGKVKPITFLVIFNRDFQIIESTVIKYREQYGGEIRNKDWLNQFSGKDINSDFNLNSGIDGISGATISARGISKGIQRAVFIITNLRKYENNIFKTV